MLIFASCACNAEWAVEPSPPITVQKVEAANYALIEQTGAYWSVGSVLAQVIEDYARIGASGPVIVRYLQHPTRTPPNQLRFQVGFALTDLAAIEPPYTRIQLPAEQVAAIRLTDTIIRPSKHYAQLEHWSRSNDFEPTGPVTELYFPPFDRSSKTTSTQSFIEVRMTIDHSKPAPESVAPSPPTQPENANPLPAVVENVPQALSESADSPLAEQDVAAPTPVPPKRDTSKPVESETIQKIISISELASGGLFDEIAKEIIPSGQSQDQGAEIWLAQFVPRLTAILGGIGKTDASSQVALKALVDAISTRHQSLFPNAKEQYKNAATLQMLGKNQDTSERHRRLIRDMDVLMAKVGYRTLDKQGVYSELLLILDRAFGTESPLPVNQKLTNP